MNNNIFDTYLESMNFLNEISINYPKTISFGSGRPKEEFFDVEATIKRVHYFIEENKPLHMSVNEYYNYLGQYNLTKGIINESIAKLLSQDEQIHVSPEDIIVTDGAQEAMAIVINTLFSSKKDVLLVSEPSYVGFVGYATVAGICTCTVKRNKNSINMDDLEHTIKRLLKEGKKPRVLYEVPDFHNPTGAYMPYDQRIKVIELAEKYDFYIVEDNPYGYYLYDSTKIPTIKSLDKYNRVIYIGSFSKSIFPSIRLGYLVVDGKVKYGEKKLSLSEQCKKVKSFITVNTSTLLQAMTGAILQKENYSLKTFCRKKIESCRENRDVLIKTLENSISDYCYWEKPPGGFFMVINIPFELTDSLILECVKNYSVIVCPLYMFCIDKNKGKNQMRLAFSNLTKEQIEVGVERLSRFIKSKAL